jgi:GTPase-activating protein SAC7
MASDITASSSSQQPFANPQPAPVPTSATAQSPPTKQSLKSWWKTFGKTTKSHDTHGNSSLQQSQHVRRPCLRPCLRPRIKHDQYNTPYLGTLYNRRSFTPEIEQSGARVAKFTEQPMTKHSPAIDGVPEEDKREALAEIKDLRRSFSFTSSVFNDIHTSKEHLPQRRHSSLLLQNPHVMRQKRSVSMLVRTALPTSPTIKRQKVGRRSGGSSLFINELDNGSSEALAAGILPSQNRNLFSRLFERMTRKSNMESTAETTVPEPEQTPGIFGVPLRQSITYANVAISLVDAEGKSYIYGYVPIVVAKCGVYLKEKGAFVFDTSGSCKLTSHSSYQC